MKININGVTRDMTEYEKAVYYSEKKRQPLREAQIFEMLLPFLNEVAVDDQTALRMMEYYPTWEDLCTQSVTAEKPGYKFVYGGELYKTVQAGYTFVPHYVPGVGTESLFERIDEQHDGSKYDPIPYSGNMALESGKYYSQDGVTYLCTRDTGNPVYNALMELVGIYVDVVQ